MTASAQQQGRHYLTSVLSPQKQEVMPGRLPRQRPRLLFGGGEIMRSRGNLPRGCVCVSKGLQGSTLEVFPPHNGGPVLNKHTILLI